MILLKKTNTCATQSAFLPPLSSALVPTLKLCLKIRSLLDTEHTACFLQLPGSLRTEGMSWPALGGGKMPF